MMSGFMAILLDVSLKDDLHDMFLSNRMVMEWVSSPALVLSAISVEALLAAWVLVAPVMGVMDMICTFAEVDVTTIDQLEISPGNNWHKVLGEEIMD